MLDAQGWDVLQSQVSAYINGEFVSSREHFLHIAIMLIYPFFRDVQCRRSTRTQERNRTQANPWSVSASQR